MLLVCVSDIAHWGNFSHAKYLCALQEKAKKKRKQSWVLLHTQIRVLLWTHAETENAYMVTYRGMEYFFLPLSLPQLCFISSSPSHLDCWQDPVPVWCVYISGGPSFWVGQVRAEAWTMWIWSVQDLSLFVLYCENKFDYHSHRHLYRCVSQLLSSEFGLPPLLGLHILLFAVNNFGRKFSTD